MSLEEANGSTNIVGLAPSGRPLVRWKRREIAAERNGQPGLEPHAANVCTWRHPDVQVLAFARPAWLLRRGSAAETIDAEAKDLTTRQLARPAARESAKKAPQAAEPTEGKPKPAPAPLTETPGQLRARVRALLLGRTT
jgi:hypothetical protein